MKLGTENYFILLELPFDPPVNDITQIKAAIQKKKSEWTRWQDNPSKRGLALTYLDKASEIQKVMLDPVQRKAQAVQAKQLKQDMLKQMEAELLIIEAKGYILPKEISSIAVKYKGYGIDKAMIITCAHCPIDDKPPTAQALEEPGEILDFVSSRAIERGLSVLAVTDLYSFLGEQPYSSIKKLLAAAELRRRSAQQNASRNAQATAAQELSGICLQVFENFDSKQRYDRYLKVSKYPELGNLIDEQFNRAAYIDPNVLLRLINFGVQKYDIAVLEAEKIIRAYCTAYSIPIDTQSKLISCPICNARVDRNAIACSSCSAPLRGECPGCGADFSEGVTACCDCGFAIGEMGKALKYIDDAQLAIIENNWSTAKRNVQYAKKYWPDNPQIAAIEKRSRILEDRYSQYIENIGDCVRHNQYYAALELVSEADARRIRLPSLTVDSVKTVVENLEAKIAKLTENDAELDLEMVMELSSTVADSIELTRMMKKHPPLTPEKLSCKAEGNYIHAKWSVSSSLGLVSYALVRKKSCLPLTAFDGDILYEGLALSYIDKSAKSLEEYYYSVFANRSGAFSLIGTSVGPIRLAPEIQNLHIVPADQSARLSWNFNPEICEVIIWRKLGGERPTKQGDGIRLENSRVDGFSDNKIKNDVEYWYFLVAVYDVNGQKVESNGICDSVMPHKFLAPVDELVVIKSDKNEDSYLVSWNGSHEDVLLMISSKPPEYKVGDIVPVHDIIPRYRRLELEMRSASSAHFMYSFNGGMYIFAVALFGKFASVGQSFYLTNVRKVENLSYDLIGKEIYINMKWPTGLQEIALAFRFDHTPDFPQESGTTTIFTTKEQYDFDAGVLLHEPEPVTYFAKVYSVFRTPDGNVVFSDGVELHIKNFKPQEIFYQFNYKRKIFAGNGNVSIALTSDQPFVLQKAVMIGKIGRLPLSKADGMPLFEISKETRVAGEITYQFQTGILPADLYVRMFLRDEAGYENCRFLPKSNSKIT